MIVFVEDFEIERGRGLLPRWAVIGELPVGAQNGVRLYGLAVEADLALLKAGLPDGDARVAIALSIVGEGSLSGGSGRNAIAINPAFIHIC